MKKVFLALVVLATIALTGCKTNNETPEPPISSDPDPKIQLGEQLPNPYLLSNMQEGLTELVHQSDPQAQVPQLQANALYVRFLPKTEEDLETLWNLGEELYLYPLDYEIKQQGLYYMDPSLGEDDYPYVYAVVSVDFVFPKMHYEILARCYIPDLNEDNVEGSFVSGWALELKASEPLRRLKPNLAPSMTNEEDAPAFPQGTVMVEGFSKWEPVRGAKVRCRTILRESEAVISDDGTYTFTEGFMMAPVYSVVYTNAKGFSLWFNVAAGAQDASVDLGEHTAKGLNVEISLQNKTYADSVNFALAAINNATCDYYDSCQAEEIKLPPKDLKIWVWSFMGSSSASMIRRVAELGDKEIRILLDKLLDFTVREGYLPELNKDLVIPVLNHIVNACKGLLPDLTIGTNTWDYTYAGFYSVAWHELTHSSHFSLLGSDVWKTYIYYVLDYGCYGDGSAPEDKKGICDVGESWAYANERYCALQFGRKGETCSKSEWFFPHYKQLDNLLSNHKLTRKQMYDCLINSSKQPMLTFDAYWEELKNKYPSVVNN